VEQLARELDPRHYVGRAPEQVAEFLRDFLEPVLARASRQAATAPTEEVRV
jgi:hypothetical protein